MRGQRPKQLQGSLDSLHVNVRLGAHDVGAFLAEDTDSDGSIQPSVSDSGPQRAPDVGVRAVVAERDGLPNLWLLVQEGVGSAALVNRGRRMDLKRHPARRDDQLGCAGSRRHRLLEVAERRMRVVCGAVVERQRDALVFHPDATGREALTAPVLRECMQRLECVVAHSGRKDPAVGKLNLNSVIAGIRDPLECHQPTQIVTGAPADEGHQAVPVAQIGQQRTDLGQDLHVFGMFDDRCNRPVDVQKHRAGRWPRCNRCDQAVSLGARHEP